MSTKTIRIEIDDTLLHALLVAKCDYLSTNIHSAGSEWANVHRNIEALNKLYDKINGALRPKKG